MKDALVAENAACVTDGKIITGTSAGTAVPFALALIEALKGAEAAGAIAGVFAPKSLSELISDFSTAMGMMLAITGSVCLLLLISTVCFLKGVG